jgi:glycosyltransferase involved in cell wall biosynthesis
MPFNPQDLTVVFITYNRSDLLATSFQAIRASKKLAGVKVLCSDDFSKPEHLAKIERMGFDRVVAAQRNGGLGRNNNKGLKACDSKYVLMVQDDCKMVNDQAVVDAMTVLQADPSVGMVRLYGDPAPFPLIERKAQGVRYWVADHTSEAYARLKAGPVRKRVYSDQPHVRRRELHEKVVGYYAEGVPLEPTEMDYEDRMDAQSELFAAFLSPHEINHFVHLGEHASFRTSTMKQRMDRFLLTFVNKLGIRDTGFYTTVRSAYRAFQTGLEKLGVMR